jgi:hypothetical protein
MSQIMPKGKTQFDNVTPPDTVLEAIAPTMGSALSLDGKPAEPVKANTFRCKYHPGRVVEKV